MFAQWSKDKQDWWDGGAGNFFGRAGLEFQLLSSMYEVVALMIGIGEAEGGGGIAEGCMISQFTDAGGRASWKGADLCAFSQLPVAFYLYVNGIHECR